MDISARHRIKDIAFFKVKIGSDKKYHVSGINIKYPMPKVTNLIDQRGITSYNIIVAFANRRETMGPKISAIKM
jgi:hypothetical protein